MSMKLGEAWLEGALNQVEGNFRQLDSQFSFQPHTGMAVLVCTIACSTTLLRHSARLANFRRDCAQSSQRHSICLLAEIFLEYQTVPVDRKGHDARTPLVPKKGLVVELSFMTGSDFLLALQLGVSALDENPYADYHYPQQKYCCQRSEVNRTQ